MHDRNELLKFVKGNAWDYNMGLTLEFDEMPQLYEAPMGRGKTCNLLGLTRKISCFCNFFSSLNFFLLALMGANPIWWEQVKCNILFIYLIDIYLIPLPRG